MRRLGFSTLALLFFSLAWVQAAEKIDPIVGALRAMGADIKLIEPFPDQAERAACGYGAPTGQQIHAAAWGWKFAGPAEPRGLVLREFIAIDAQNEVQCFDSIEVGDLNFEESAVIGGRIALRNRIPTRDLASSTTITFGYEWRRMATRLSMDFEASHIGSGKSLSISTALGLGGIDVISLQENKASQNPLAFLTASLQSFSLRFYDRGLRDVIFENIARETGESSQRLTRQAHSKLEQTRQLLDATGNQVLGAAISVVQDTIVDGGGGEIQIAPKQPVTMIELFGGLQTQSFDSIFEAMNMTSTRLP